MKSGQLVAPGIAQQAEHEFMKKMIDTWENLAHGSKTNAPAGPPQLMMGFTADGQADQAMVRDRDKRMGIASAEKRKHRESISAPVISPGADAWQQLSLQPVAQGEIVAHPLHFNSQQRSPSR